MSDPWDGFLIPQDEQVCACRIDTNGLADYVCDQHRMRMYQNEFDMRQGLDQELDECIRAMFGDRKFERSTVPVGTFAVAKR